MQRPKFNLEPEDSAKSKTAMLTDGHMQREQELLHRQFPYIEGLMRPSISTVRQFAVMRQEFVQVLYTGGLHWVTLSTIGCKGNILSSPFTVTANSKPSKLLKIPLLRQKDNHSRR